MRGQQRRATLIAALVVVVCIAIGGVPTAQAQDGEIVHVATTRLGPRLEELSFTSPLLSGPTHVRVILPTGYDATTTEQYPVLWLLHGGGGSWRDWTDAGDALAATADLPLIVVMPDSGAFGGYVDWWNYGAGGTPQWETFHLQHLLPWLDEHYRTVDDRSGRAIAGLSMGGGGAMHYASRHPDVFVGAAAFSGAVDTNTLPVQLLVETSGLQELRPPGSLFGPRLTDEVRWRGHNPWDLAENLQGLFLQLDTGNGQPGGPGGDVGDPIEGQCWVMMTNLHQRLEALGTPHIWNDYGPGGHTWFYWRRDLRELLPRLMDVFADPPPPPEHVRYRSIDPSWSVYGWSVAITRPALEFSHLRDASADGFALEGSGTAVVTTPPQHAPGSTVLATITDAAGTAERELVADGQGRVTVPVDLGPGNTQQQLSPAGNLITAANDNTWPAVTATVDLEEAAAAPAASAPTESQVQELPATGSTVSLPTAAVLALASAASVALRRRANSPSQSGSRLSG